jgi:hypothetical protein
MPTPLRPADMAVRQLAPLLVGSTIEEIERELILCTLAATAGSRTQAADLLGISIRTLRNRIREYGSRGMLVPPPSGRGRADSVPGGHDGSRSAPVGHFPSWLRLERTYDLPAEPPSTDAVEMNRSRA